MLSASHSRMNVTTTMIKIPTSTTTQGIMLKLQLSEIGNANFLVVPARACPPTIPQIRNPGKAKVRPSLRWR